MDALAEQAACVRVDGSRLQYVVEGAGTPTLVIGSSVYYPRTFAAELRQSLQMAFVDLRHFAERDRSSAPNAITLETYANDIELVRASLAFDRVVLVGHSHHGNLALEYARLYPEAVSHLVLIGSPPCDVDTTIRTAAAYWVVHAPADRRAALRENWSRLTPERLALMSREEQFVARYVADGPKYWVDPHYDAAWLWQGVPINLKLVSSFRDFVAGYALTWNPHQMKAPVLVVMGRHDYAVPCTLWDAAKPNLPPFTLRIFERSGHTPQLEEPDLFNHVLVDWIRAGSR